MYLFKYIYKLSSVQQIIFSWLVVNNIFKAELIFIGKKRNHFHDSLNTVVILAPAP